MKTELYFRAAEVESADGTIKLSFASELPVLRDDGEGKFWEILSHEPGDANLGFINRKGIALQDHNEKLEIGDVVPNSVSIGTDKKTRGELKLFDTGWQTRTKTDWAKIPISVGYVRLSVVSEIMGEDKIPVRRFAWSPFEVSLLTCDAADAGVGINRAKETREIDFSKITDAEITNLVKQRNIIIMAEKTEITPETQQAAVAEAQKQARANERQRITGIRELGDAFKRDYKGDKAHKRINELIAEGEAGEVSPAEWSANVMRKEASSFAAENVKVIAEEDLHEDIKHYSYARALRTATEQNKEGALPTGLELEVHQSMAKRSLGFNPGGFLVPYSRKFCVTGTRHARKSSRAAGDLQVGIFGQGGGLVPTELYMPMIGLLRNLMVTERLGMQSIAGLEGMVTWPRHVAACTPYFVPETFLLNVSNPLLDQLAASPHRVGVTGAVSKQLLLQGAIDAQNWLRDDQLKSHAVLIDQVSLLGTGANNQPVGIFNTPGIGAVNFGGAVTYQKVVNFKTQLALGNAAVADMAFVTTPLVEEKWRTTAKIGTTFPIFIWEDGSWGDETADGRVIGLRATATNQITNDRVGFGNFADAKKLFWGGLDVVINPYTRSKEAVIEVTTNSWMDVMVDHQQSFAYSVDAGDQ